MDWIRIDFASDDHDFHNVKFALLIVFPPFIFRDGIKSYFIIRQFFSGTTTFLCNFSKFL